MVKNMVLGTAIVGVVVLGVSLVALPGGAEWTTSSPDALAEFEAAVNAQMKLYPAEAAAHLERALELDPDFVIVKLYLADLVKETDEDRALRLWNDVLTADLSKLSDRERLLIERARAMQEKRYDDAEGMIDAYLEEHPNDPFVMHRKALTLWVKGDFDEAERLNRRLIEIAPNWVIAYNQLGYIAMSRGRFVEAEEYFTSYRFVAPDQANPHDSLGELFVALGRYDEAEASFEKALEIKPDFWAAYEHIALMKTFTGDLDGARVIVERARTAGMPENWVDQLDCLERYMGLFNGGAWKEIYELAESSKCVARPDPSFAKIATHKAACELRKWDEAVAIEAAAEELLAKVGGGGTTKEVEMVRASVAHMRGVRLALQGKYAEAEDQLRAADEGLTYIEAGSAIYKLYNRMILAEVMLAGGQDAEAHTLLSKIRSVNPTWVAMFEDSGLKILGLERG